MKRSGYLFLKIIFAILVILLIAGIACFTSLDTTPFQRTDFYGREMDTLSHISASGPEEKSGALEVGWSRANLLPAFTTPIAIDAHRGGKHYEGVHDSIYVRAFVFRRNGKKVAYISADLLIIPPTVTRIFDTLLAREGYDAQNIFFTATHTHTSIGAWHDSYVGEIFAGKYDARVPAHIAHVMADAIKAAEKNCAPAKIGFAEIPTSKLVFNRLVKEKGKVDSMLRIVKIEKADGERAAIITFAAHCTVFHEHMMQLSGDWGGIMMTALNASGRMGFACFSAGAVGSHGPYEITKDQELESKYMADHVAAIVLASFDSIKVDDAGVLRMQHVPLYLREPDMRVTQSIAIRPWLFKKLFGNEKVYINTLQIGDIFFAGTPCDFSGELVGALDSTAYDAHLHLLVTSFNGGYMGYVTDSKWYELNKYETRTMGWFGPGNGDYFIEVIRILIGKSRNG